MTREKPIPFSAPMVRAILNGTKTQTRRVVKGYRTADGSDEFAPPLSGCPHQPFDRLWVREEHAFSVVDPEGYDWHDDPENWDVIYRADESQPAGGWRDRDGNVISAPWRPSIRMPRWASRITLEVTAIRVERLLDISEADAKAEGCDRLYDDETGYIYRDEPDWKLCPRCGGTRLYTAFGPNGGALPDTDCEECNTYVKRYQRLWESINGPGSWDANPWVWVVEFALTTTSKGGA